MTGVKIDSKAALDNLLRIVAEESVTLARAKVQKEGQELADYQERQRQFQLVQQLNDLTSAPDDSEPDEEEPVEEEDESEPGDDAAAAAPEEPAAEPAEEPAEEPPVDDQEDPVEDPDDEEETVDKITYGMIKDKLNTIRSGKSLKDEEIRTELKSYFKKLSDEERISLHTFLSAIAGILTSGIEGEVADEPSNPPHDVQMSRDQETEPAPEMSKVVHKRRRPGGEDTSPPIQVGRQNTESIRRHVRTLMGG